MKKPTVKRSKFETRAEKKARFLSEQRENVFLPARLDLLKQFAASGADDEAICATYGISPELFAKWLALYPSMKAALREGRLSVDLRVEQAVLKRATGYEYTEEAPTKNGSVMLRRHMPADMPAAKFWLTNKQSGKWRERHQLDLHGSLEVTDKRVLIDDLVKLLTTPGQAALAVTGADIKALAPPKADEATKRADNASAPDPIELTR